MRLFSGIQPTGLLHLGNYFGAIKNWVILQKKYPSLFCIVDYHAITISYQTKKISENVLNLAMDLIACGIDPKKSILLVQSAVSEHTELAWILGTVTSISDLQRMTQFKEKAKEHAKSVNAGLFNYPILMAADILLYKARVVPVGEDQRQHLELAREIARRFNKTFGRTFPEPKPLLTPGARIMSLTNPEKKMSKSYGPESYLALSDSSKTIYKKLSTAVTDLARKRRTDPGTPGKCNLYSLHQLVSNKKDLAYISNGCQKAKIGCLECKKLLAENIFKELKPIQAKRKKLEKNPEKIKKILQQGADRARKIAQKTMTEVKKKMGLNY
ncbi:tryptophan--tRNA ligase [Patescibacteria group bacterium]|nr:tryptophan--tRNA ligase [Patescibacteria group bacterium]